MFEKFGFGAKKEIPKNEEEVKEVPKFSLTKEQMEANARRSQETSYKVADVRPEPDNKEFFIDPKHKGDVFAKQKETVAYEGPDFGLVSDEELEEVRKLEKEIDEYKTPPNKYGGVEFTSGKEDEDQKAA